MGKHNAPVNTDGDLIQMYKVYKLDAENACMESYCIMRGNALELS
jgi:hypothetical protein